jgi:GNAT superfamily N-acetyltransferase
VRHDATIQLGAAPLARAWLDPICGLYDAVFSTPPFRWEEEESANHRQRTQRLLASGTFGVAIATQGGQLVGFAYGLTLLPDTRWWSGLPGDVPAEITAERPGRTFALIDFAVREDWRGRGIGRELHDRLLASRPEERATLTVEPAAVETQRIYCHWGWRKIGQVTMPPGAPAPFFDVFVKPLREEPGQAKP